MFSSLRSCVGQLLHIIRRLTLTISAPIFGFLRRRPDCVRETSSRSPQSTMEVSSPGNPVDGDGPLSGLGLEENSFGTAVPFRPGDIVVLHGLQSSRGVLLNGRLGQVHPEPITNGRLCIRCMPSHSQADCKRVNPQNLRAITPAPAGSIEAAGVIAQLAQGFLLKEVLEILPVEELCCLRSCNRQFLHWDAFLASTAWQQACTRHWASKSPRFHLTDARRLELTAAFPSSGWRQFYHNQMSAAREPFQSSDFTELSWAFNFSVSAGGNGLGTAQLVKFGPTDATHGSLFLRGYPPLPYVLHDDGGCLDIANFPIHVIRRLPSWEWHIRNDNVILISGPALSRLPDLPLTDRDLCEFPDARLLGTS